MRNPITAIQHAAPPASYGSGSERFGIKFDSLTGDGPLRFRPARLATAAALVKGFTLENLPRPRGGCARTNRRQEIRTLDADWLPTPSSDDPCAVAGPCRRRPFQISRTHKSCIRGPCYSTRPFLFGTPGTCRRSRFLPLSLKFLLISLPLIVVTCRAVGLRFSCGPNKACILPLPNAPSSGPSSVVWSSAAGAGLGARNGNPTKANGRYTEA